MARRSNGPQTPRKIPIRMTVSSTEIRIEPRQPNRLEKKKNMPGIPLQTAGGSMRISNSGDQAQAGVARVWSVRPSNSCRTSSYGSFVRKAPRAGIGLAGAEPPLSALLGPLKRLLLGSLIEWA